MLLTLRIRNFAIVETLELTGEPGLTVFTGETGAGKTILVEAIRFLLGGRASSEMVRTGADTAVIEGLFDGGTDGLPEASRFWLRRELMRSGTSRAFLDDRQITRTVLQELGEKLADLCGQHQQQQLLDPARHRELLDQFAGAGDLAAAVRDSWDAHAVLTREHAALGEEIDRCREQEELRRFQIEEIRAANVLPDEDEGLKAEAGVLKNSRRLTEAAEHALAALAHDDTAVDALLGRLQRDADRLAGIDPRWTAIGERLANARDAVEDTTRAITDYRQSLEFDPGRLDQIEARRTELYRLKSKYGGSCAAVRERLRNLENEATDLADRETRAAGLSGRIELHKLKLIGLAEKLTARRGRGATRLEKRINGALPKLGMAGARVRVAITPIQESGTLPVGEHGAEDVAFLFEANPNEGYKSLHKIASGGELSRLLLAFKALTVADNDPKLYIFDEIDSGIGGQTAGIVARRIAALAGHAQVFLISHLQQMAAVADRHYLITKRTTRGRARVTIDRLEGERRVRELARMVAGDEVTDRTLDYASELAGQKPSQ